jgi:alpha-ketoglutaric semialdehyde dehydrogenase
LRECTSLCDTISFTGSLASFALRDNQKQILDFPFVNHTCYFEGKWENGNQVEGSVKVSTWPHALLARCSERDLPKMDLHGKSIIGSETAESEGKTFRGFDPTLGKQLEPLFHEATDNDIERAFALAEGASTELRHKSAQQVAGFLESIGKQINSLGDELIDRASSETGLPSSRLTGERARTINQLRMFADVVREGSWVEATIDRPQPERVPIAKPDLRRMLIPIGPVVVFGASNFPLAFSVAGGDTASALAAGNPVIVKAHPAHPGTSEMVARAIARAADETDMPAGVFSLLQGASPELSLKLVSHKATAAVGFTGSLRAGRAIYDAASRRAEPIPIYAEKGRINTVFDLPGALH